MKNAQWLLDGFPRTIPQCDGLMRMIDLGVVINLDVPFDEIISRVKGEWQEFFRYHLPSGHFTKLLATQQFI